MPGKSHGWRSLVGCHLWGRTKSDTTERLHFHFSLWCIGEENGNPLQCSCLENPRDGGALWAAIYGVAQSQTRLKWLSSSRDVEHFSCDFWPSVYLLWRNVYLDLLPIKKKIYLFWLHWVFVAAHRLPLVVESGDHCLMWCSDLLWWLLLLQSTVSRHPGFGSCNTWAQ